MPKIEELFSLPKNGEEREATGHGFPKFTVTGTTWGAYSCVNSDPVALCF
jgi:hypothetical protein